MGTNYYVRTKRCKYCGHKPDSIHLGKSSGGWQFSFQYNNGDYYKSVGEMKIWLKGKKIVNEYGQFVSQKEFWQMIADKQRYDKINHARDCGDGLLIDGYSFTDGQFS